MLTDLKPREKELLAAFDAGEARALARAISWVENGRSGFERLLAAVHERVGRAHRIGITGPPGAGKSTLIHGLAEALRERGERVGVVAVDPTSPFTGGALLGDRIRMARTATDDGVFIRSMASRGSLGGLATTTREVADLLDAFGFDRVIVETVGVGQSELEIADAADSTVVVLTPESGDSVQTMKAGLMEIADVFVVNKGDRPQADRLVAELRATLRIRGGQAYDRVPAHHGVDLTEMAKKRTAGEPARVEDGDGEGPSPWSIPVLKTTAQDGSGVDSLLEALDAHLSWLKASGRLQVRRGERVVERVKAVVERHLTKKVWETNGEKTLASARADLESGKRTPYDVAGEIVKNFEDRGKGS